MVQAKLPIRKRARSRSIYKEIRVRVQEEHGRYMKSCWIAHVLRDHGLTTRVAANRLDSKTVAYPCPARHRGKIEAALAVAQREQT